PLAVVFADEGIDPHEVQVILDQHEIPRGKITVHGAGSICNDKGSDTERGHEPYAHRHLRHCITFVKVHTPLHHQHRGVFDKTADKFTAVAFDSRLREMWNRAVRNGDTFFSAVGEP